MQKTLVLIKPDGMKPRGFVDDVILRLRRIGLELIKSEVVVPTPNQVEYHYTVDEKWILKCGSKAMENYRRRKIEPPSKDPAEIGFTVLDQLKKYLSGKEVVVMIWQGQNAVEAVKKIVGPTEPLSAQPGTIRGDWSTDSYGTADAEKRAMENLIHASDSAENAEKEIQVWF